MKISELQANAKVTNLVARVVSLEEIAMTPNELKFREGVLEDETGQVDLTLWNGQTGEFVVGDKVLLSIGWCKEFEGQLKVSTGKFGKITKVPPEKA
jgi:ssDNA-binding replication factor A large subunit